MLSKDWESFEKSDIAWWRVINICRDSLSVFFALPIGIAHHRTYIQWRLCRLPLADLLLYNRSCCISMDVSVQLVGASCRASRRTESLMKQKLPWIHCVVWHIVYTFITISTKYWPKNKSRVSRMGSRPGDPKAGPRGRTLRFWGSGQVGVDSIRPRGAPGQGPEGP